MEVVFNIILIILIYKLVMPFIAWIVPQNRMESAAKYIERTERRFPTKNLFNYFNEFRKKRNTENK